MVKKLPSINLEKFKLPFSGHIGDMVAKAGGPTAAKVGVGGAFLGAGFDAVSASKQERAFLSDLVEEYRPEIAERMGLAAEQVTQEHFEQAYRDNPVLAQAKDLSKVETKTRVASGVIGVVAGWFAGMTAAGLTTGAQRGQVVKDSQRNAANIASGIVSTMASMMSGKVARKFLHRKGENTLSESAHGQIIAIRDKQLQGQPTSPTDIFKVQLALNPEVDQMIVQAYGSPFGKLDEAAQLQLLQNEFPEVLQVNTELARRVNDGARPQGLLFGEVEDVKPRAINSTTTEPQVRPKVADVIAKAPSEKELANANAVTEAAEVAVPTAAVAAAGKEALDALDFGGSKKEQAESAVAKDAAPSLKPAASAEKPEAAKPEAPKASAVQSPIADPAFETELEQLLATLEKDFAKQEAPAAGGDKAKSFVQQIEGERSRAEQAPQAAARG